MMTTARVCKAAVAQWDIAASVVLSRSPIIAPPMSAIEEKFNFVQLQEQKEKSLLNDYELKTKQDIKILERREKLLAEGKELSELDEEIGVTNVMREEEWNLKANSLEQKYNNFLPNAGEGVSRQLDRQLVLIVKQKFGEKKYSSPWILPQLKHRAGETLRQTAERCIGEISATDVNVRIAGNAPFSVYSYRYPKPLKEKTGSVGAKIFFFRANLEDKNQEFEASKEEISEHQWVTSEEFFKTVPNSSYKSSLRTAFLE